MAKQTESGPSFQCPNCSGTDRKNKCRVQVAIACGPRSQKHVRHSHSHADCSKCGQALRHDKNRTLGQRNDRQMENIGEVENSAASLNSQELIQTV